MLGLSAEMKDNTGRGGAEGIGKVHKITSKQQPQY